MEMLMLKIFTHILRFNMKRKDQKRLGKQTAPSGVHVVKDMPYHPDKKKEHLLDVYYPKEVKGKLPVIIDVHGGALVYGYKENNEFYNMQLASYGYCVFSMNYRLAPTVKFHEQLQDVLDAFAWIRERLLLTQYRGDIGSVFVNGDSAGALLGLYATAVCKNPELETIFQVKGTPLDIKALGLVHGMLYTTKKDMLGTLQKLYYGKKLDVPYYDYMDPKRIIETCILPPCYLVTSEEDEIMPYTITFQTLLEEYHIEHKFRVFQKVEDKQFRHIFSVLDPFLEESQDTMQEMLDFFQAVITKKEES